jgi:hypothetical protein
VHAWRASVLELRRAGCQSHRSSPSLTAQSGSGKHLVEYGPNLASTAAGEQDSLNELPKSQQRKPSALGRRGGWRKPKRSRDCIRCLHQNLCDQIRQSPKKPGKGPRGVCAPFYSPLSKEAFANETSDRNHVRDLRRTIRSKDCLSNETALAMVFKLVDNAQKTWRRLDGYHQCQKIIQGVTFADWLEIAVTTVDAQAQAATSSPRPSPKKCA